MTLEDKYQRKILKNKIIETYKSSYLTKVTCRGFHEKNSLSYLCALGLDRMKNLLKEVSYTSAKSRGFLIANTFYPLPELQRQLNLILVDMSTNGSGGQNPCPLRNVNFV